MTTTSTTHGGSMTPRARRLIERASAKAGSLGVEATGVEHLLFAMLEDPDSVAFGVLDRVLDVDAVRAELAAVFESDSYLTGSARRVKGMPDGSLVPVDDAAPFADD
jgi:ATP-dependent Clp protease ATP-binding subunit ClpA